MRRVAPKYKLVVYVPKKALTSTKKAIFDAGGGRLGNYDCCSWQVLGEGQFRPLEGSNPNIGKVGEVEVVSEWRLEVLVNKEVLSDVVKAMRRAHPYEEPAYEIYECVQLEM